MHALTATASPLRIPVHHDGELRGEEPKTTPIARWSEPQTSLGMGGKTSGSVLVSAPKGMSSSDCTAMPGVTMLVCQEQASVVTLVCSRGGWASPGVCQK
eukprot:2274897-Rhodomonas_salina.1